MKQILFWLSGAVCGAAIALTCVVIRDTTRQQAQMARDAMYVNRWKSCYDDDRYFAFQAYRSSETWCLKLSKGPLGIWTATEVHGDGRR